MHLLFDLDGTLTDSFSGISRCINHALAEVGRDPVPEIRLRALIGTPLNEIVGVLLESDDRALLMDAVAAYRARFNAAGYLEGQVFPGIPEALSGFQTAGHLLQIVTAKPAVTARRVLEHLGLAGYFAAIHGPAPGDRRCNKADLVRAALEVAAGDAAHVVMIGDRADDVRAARVHGVRAVGVTWGYGSRSELVEAGPDYLADTVSDLVAWVQAVG